jgi:hypothetical protein
LGLIMPLHGLTDKFLAAVATDHVIDRQVLVKNAAGTKVLADITEDVTAGSVSVDETREFRRTMSLSINATSALIPEHPGDLLHPATANEVWISRGVKYTDGTTELAPLGVFRLSKPVVGDTNRPAGLTFTISGNDRASVVARQGWQQPYQVASGSNPGGVIQAALQKLIGSIYPDLDYSGIQPSTFLYPSVIWGATAGQQSDPMSDMQTFAAAPGQELFFDVVGNPILRPVPNPLLVPVTDSVHFVEGDNCTMTQVQKALDETVAYNGVILYCNGPGSAGPFVQKVWDTDPSSATYFLGPWGQVPYFMTTTLIPASTDSIVAAQQKALYMAQQQLQLILGALDTTTLQSVPNPALREGDCLKVVHARTRTNNNYVISNMTIPLDTAAAHQIGFRPQVSAA